jgi:hypothetical protein
MRVLIDDTDQGVAYLAFPVRTKIEKVAFKGLLGNSSWEARTLAHSVPPEVDLAGGGFQVEMEKSDDGAFSGATLAYDTEDFVGG